MEALTQLNNWIGEKSRFKGEFELEGDLRIDGTFQGLLKTNGKLLIGKRGKCMGNIVANEVIVGGFVDGSVIAREKLTILESGRIKGNIASAALKIEKGTKFSGFCKVNPELYKKDTEKADQEKLDNELLTSLPKMREQALKKKIQSPNYS
jgi:cytoskeletal protein CcmA (bactofilin family)